MRPDYMQALHKLTTTDRRENRALVALAFVFGVFAGGGGIFGYMQHAMAQDDARDLLPTMVASVALRQQINPAALWEDVVSSVGKPYAEFSGDDIHRGMRFLGRKMTLPPQKLPIDHQLVY
jgi:hypothetical protein